MTIEKVYTTYIKATPEKIWQAITTPEFAKQYWGGNTNISDWKQNSEWKHVANDSQEVYVIGKVLESKPTEKLIVTWASPKNPSDESQVIFEISKAGDLSRLDVTHIKLSEEMATAINKGWPLVLSSLKSFLETGIAIDIQAVKGKCA